MIKRTQNVMNDTKDNIPDGPAPGAPQPEERAEQNDSSHEIKERNNQKR
jgi:hypothetical protein